MTKNVPSPIPSLVPESAPFSEEQRTWRAQMTRIAADPVLSREYLLKVSMIASLRNQEGIRNV